VIQLSGARSGPGAIVKHLFPFKAWLREIPQLRVLGLGFLQDGDVGITVFPEDEGSLDMSSSLLPGRRIARRHGPAMSTNSARACSSPYIKSRKASQDGA